MVEQTEQADAIWQNRIVGYELVAPYELLDNPFNFRVHSALQQTHLVTLLEQVGWVDVVKVNQNSGRIVDGHLRVEKARQEDEAMVPVLWLDLTDEEEQLVLASLDWITEQAEVDVDRLQLLLAQVAATELLVDESGILEAIAESAGITIDAGDYGEIEDPGPQIERADELREKWGVERGQLWQLGEHRLICGDSRDPEVVARLMDGQTAALFATDPPYMIDYTGAERVGGGKDWSALYQESQIEDKEAFLEGVFTTWTPHLRQDAAWFVWHASKTHCLFQQALETAGVLVHEQIIWVKPVHVMGYAKYSYRHEPCFFGWMKGHTPYYRPGWWNANDTSVWEIDYEGKKRSVGAAHPTQKPIEIFARPIRNHTKPGEICAEPFSGSGSQIIAGEQEGRRVYACEIQPSFVAVALERWHEATGKEPVLVE